MLVIMFTTFLSTSVTKFRTDLTKIFYIITSKAHNFSASFANSSAFHAKLSATSHVLSFFDVLRRAMVTKCRTIQTCVDARFIGVVICHRLIVFTTIKQQIISQHALL